MVIFLTITNTLSDTLSTRSDLGFSLPESSISINHLLYTDDTCMVSSSPAGFHHLLDMVQGWLEWTHLKAKVPKCRSMVVQASTGKRVTSDLSIGGKAIPVVDDNSFKFLGKPVHFYKSNHSARDSIRQHLQQMLDAIDNTPLTRQQNLCLFRFRVCPRMSWPLLIEDLPISWLERELQPLATTALKKWAGLARSSCTSILFFPVKQGGLAIPSLVGSRLPAWCSSSHHLTQVSGKLLTSIWWRRERVRGQSSNQPLLSMSSELWTSLRVDRPSREQPKPAV